MPSHCTTQKRGCKCCCVNTTCCLNKCIPRTLFMTVTIPIPPSKCDKTFPIVFDPNAILDCGDGFPETGCWVANNVLIGTCSTNFKFGCKLISGSCTFVVFIDDTPVRLCDGCFSPLVGTCNPLDVSIGLGTTDCWGFACGCNINQPNEIIVQE